MWSQREQVQTQQLFSLQTGTNSQFWDSYVLSRAARPIPFKSFAVGGEGGASVCGRVTFSLFTKHTTTPTIFNTSAYKQSTQHCNTNPPTHHRKFLSTFNKTHKYGAASLLPTIRQRSFQCTLMFTQKQVLGVTKAQCVQFLFVRACQIYHAWKEFCYLWTRSVPKTSQMLSKRHFNVLLDKHSSDHSSE